MEFKYYVLNWDYNRQQSYMFNIFDNIIVNKDTEKAVKKYLRAPNKYIYEDYTRKQTYTGFEALCLEINRILRYSLWARCEYEILVGNDFGHDKYEKWDCYMQCKPNIEMIAREVIYQYKTFLKEKKDGEK